MRIAGDAMLKVKDIMTKIDFDFNIGIFNSAFNINNDTDNR